MGQESALLRERIGLQMLGLEGRKRPRERASLAQVAGRTPRTLRTWKKNPRGGRQGRPPHSFLENDRARRLVLAELRVQGWTATTSSIDHALKAREVPTRLTRTWMRTIRREIKEDERAYMQERRLHIDVLGPDVMTSIDATHVCREPTTSTVETTPTESSENPNADLTCDANKVVETPAPQWEPGPSRGRSASRHPCKGASRAARRRRGRAVQALMVVDVGTMLKVGFKIVHAPSGEDVIDLLLAIRSKRGTFPLVVSSDNGPENVNAAVAAFFEEHKIIHLRSLPHTPRHNPVVERSHREVKPEAALEMLTLDPSLDLIDRVQTCIARAVDRLNNRPRASRKWQTAVKLDTDLPRPYTVVARDAFYDLASAAMRAARAYPGSTRQQRLAERWALYAVMEGFGLIKLFRGGVPITALKTEGIT